VGFCDGQLCFLLSLGCVTHLYGWIMNGLLPKRKFQPQRRRNAKKLCFLCVSAAKIFASIYAVVKAR